LTTASARAALIAVRSAVGLTKDGLVLPAAQVGNAAEQPGN
jgi:hypothetical protein